jgi:hypothetical protein
LSKVEFIARMLLPVAVLTPVLPMVHVVQAQFRPGYSEQQLWHHPDEPVHQHQMPDFGRSVAAITTSFTASVKLS